MKSISGHHIMLRTLFIGCVIAVMAHGDMSDKDIVKVALQEVMAQHSNKTCEVTGEIPIWLQGYFLRQSCGSFGSLEDTGIPNSKITHLADCLGMVVSYELNRGKVLFSNRYYDNQAFNVWQEYSNNLTSSRVAWPTAFTPFDVNRTKQWATSFPKKYQYQPSGNFWKVKNSILAVTETLDAMSLEAGSLKSLGNYNWQDGNRLGLSSNTEFIGNVVHAKRDQDGTLWSVATAMDFNLQTYIANLSYIIYKIAPNSNRREIVSRLYTGPSQDRTDISARQCLKNRYTDEAYLPGYIHSFASTDNYIVLPVSSWLFDPCRLITGTDFQNPEPFLKANYHWSDTKKSQLLIFRKSDGVNLGSIPVDPMLPTHQINSYEDGDSLVLDIVTHNNSQIYDTNGYVDSILAMNMYPVSMERFTVNTTNWSLTERSHLTHDRHNADFVTVNPSYDGRDYSYMYTTTGSMLPGNTQVVKLNVKTTDTNRWTPPEKSQLLWEPVFISPPGGSRSEDDGILLIAGVDAQKQKGTLTILNATTMQLLSHVTAPELTPIGLHGRFFPWDLPPIVDLPPIKQPDPSSAHLTNANSAFLLGLTLVVNLVVS